MPKPMLKQPQAKADTGSILSAAKPQENKQQAQQMDKMKLDRLLHKPRSKEYMDAMRKLDAGGHTHNKNRVNEIIDAIKNEFPEVKLEGILIGIVSVCYLGEPYEVHTLDVRGDIIEHYKRGEILPNGMERARSIALHGGYEFIEVYIDCCRCVSSVGTVSVVSF